PRLRPPSGPALGRGRRAGGARGSPRSRSLRGGELVTPAPVFEFAGVTGGYGSRGGGPGLAGAVAPGEVLGVLGRNGVGKSTLLKLLHGFLPLRDGEIRHRGGDIRALTPAERSRLGISFAPQERIAFDNLSVRENLWLMHPGRRLDHVEPYFQRFPRLRERLGEHPA